MIESISPEQLHSLHQGGKHIELLDVRTPAEFREVHIEFAKNLPLDQLDVQQFKASRNESSGELYVVCRSGGRSKQACEKLSAAGLSVVDVEGGTLAWTSAGLPVARGKKSVSLERQVRITAGSIVFLGAMLAIFVHPYWAGLSAFIGGGLVFSGVTDTCGMGLVLAKMPWNRA